MIRWVYLLYIFIILTSCSRVKSFDNHIDYLTELNKHSEAVIKDNTWEGYHFVTQYIPKEKYILQRVLKKGEHLDTLNYRSHLDEMGDKMVFRLKLSENETGILGDAKRPDEAYFAKLQYFIDPARNDINLIQGADTLMSHDYHFERYYDYAPYSAIVVSFDTDSRILENDFIIKFSYPFISEKAKIGSFEFESEKLKRLPKLNI